MRMKNEKRAQMREWLNRYRFLVKEIKAREEHMKDFIEDVYNPLRATTYSDMPKAKGVTSDQTLKTVLRIERQYAAMIKDMHDRIKALNSAKQEIEDALATLDEYERCVLYHRYVLGIFWADLPEYINYERAQCQNIEVKALDKLIGRKLGAA